MKPVLLLIAAVLACDAQSRNHDEVSAAQTKERANALVHLDAGPLKLDVYISETAQLFHVVDQISQWSEFSHPQYVRYFESQGGGLSESDLRILAEHVAIRKKYGWDRGPEQLFYTPLDLDEALKAGVASGYLTDAEADTERRILTYFRPSCKAAGFGVIQKRVMDRSTTKLIAGLAVLSFSLSAQSPDVGNRKHLIYHDIQTDEHGNIVPWYDKDPGVAYDHVLHLIWNYWKNVPLYSNNDPEFHKRYKAYGGVKKYFVARTLDEMGVGGDQFAMILSSWGLYYQYTGDPEVLADMRNQADTYLANGLSAVDAEWPNIPYPCNTSKILAVYDGDLVMGKSYTQPDKAGSFGAELVTLYKITGEHRYLDAARNIADTLAAKTRPGDDEHSPLPFRVRADNGTIKDSYTTNWTGTLRLFEDLVALKEGKVAQYRKADQMIEAWLKRYPVKTHKWGPFFEDVDKWSDTEINAGTLAWYTLEHPQWDTNWREDVRSAQDWVTETLGIDYWKQYGLTVIGEQTVYHMQGQSHSSRHASVELLYSEKTGDDSRKAEAIRLLNWATYMVDFDGKNWYPNFENCEIWWTDGYGDYVRHYLRAMGAAPELAPTGQNHLLRTSSVTKSVTYAANRIVYETFDDAGTEVLRLTNKPHSVRCQGLIENDWKWEPLAQGGGVLRVSRNRGSRVEIDL